jgi:hypothetical protein
VVLTCPSSSGRHAVIKTGHDGVYVSDLNSSNGTRVNGAEIEEAKLKDGDRVGFGDVQAVFYAGDPPAVLEEKPVAPPAKKGKTGKALPPPVIVADKEVPSPSAVASKSDRPLSPVRRAYAKPSASSYPDTSESGCMSALIVTALFVFAFVVGLAMRHSKEMNGNLMSDMISKISGSMPSIKIERKDE